MTRIKKLAILIGDVALLYGALALTLLVRYPVDQFGRFWGDHVGPFTLVFAVWVLVFYLMDLYHPRAFQTSRTNFQALVRGTLLAGTISIIAFYLFGEFFRLTPKTNLALFGTAFFVLDFSWRRFLLVIARSRGLPLTVLGNSPAISEIISHLKHHKHTGYQVKEWIQSWNNGEVTPQRLAARGPQAVVAHTSALQHPGVVNTLYHLLPFETILFDFADFYEHMFEKVPIDEIDEQWFLEHITTRRPIYDALKRFVDVVLSLVLLAVFAIPALVIAFAVKLTSPGPVIYKQRRTGQQNRPFLLYKFRTMRVDADRTGPHWTTEGDDRITPFGAFLRWTHLDEIPQLWNIFRGDLSFTGPRPEALELSALYSQLPYYDIRHIVKPGLTGWAQVKYRPSASLEEAEEKLRYDIYYIKNRSFLLDALIMIRTIRYIVLGSE